MSSKNYKHKAPARSKRTKAEIDADEVTPPLKLLKAADGKIDFSMGTFNNLPLPALEDINSFRAFVDEVAAGGTGRLPWVPRPITPPRAHPPKEVARRALPCGDSKHHRLAPFVFEALGVEVQESAYGAAIVVKFRTMNRVHGTPLTLYYHHRTSPFEGPVDAAVEIPKAITAAMQHELAEHFLRADGSYVTDPHPEERTYGRREAPPPTLPQSITIDFAFTENMSLV